MGDSQNGTEGTRGSWFIWGLGLGFRVQDLCGFCRDYGGPYYLVCKDHMKSHAFNLRSHTHLSPSENGSYYSILGLYWDNGK